MMVEGAHLVDVMESGAYGRRQVCGHPDTRVPLLKEAQEGTSCSPLHSAIRVALCISRETLRCRCLSVKEREETLKREDMWEKGAFRDGPSLLHSACVCWAFLASSTARVLPIELQGRHLPAGDVMLAGTTVGSCCRALGADVSSVHHRDCVHVCWL